jgi:hypothetical protein
MSLRPWLAISLLLVLGACATAETTRDAPIDAGVANSYAAPYDRVTAATLDTIRALNVNITATEEKPNGLQIQVTKSANLFSWGEVGRIMVERSPTPTTVVRVFWQKRSQVQVTGTSQADFSNDLFSGIQQRLSSR